MQDFTGVPCVVDLVAMGDAMTAVGGDSAKINPLIPTDLVIDHSVIADVFGRSDTLVGTDSHTPMINGRGVLGWGSGDIEAEAAMLGQPMSILIPQVVDLKLTGELTKGTTVIDLVLAMAELLRRTGVEGQFVDFSGPGVAAGVEGGYTRHLPDGEAENIFDAARAYAADDVPLIVLTGADYGPGPSRAWAAKGTMLLGVKAVLATSFERIHRANLIGMGVLPLQFTNGQTTRGLGLTEKETYSITGLEGAAEMPSEVTVRGDAGDQVHELTARVRIDTPAEAAYCRHGGILPLRPSPDARELNPTCGPRCRFGTPALVLKKKGPP